MPKRSKTPKTYRVRVVNPSRPGAPRFMGEENPSVRKVEAFSKHRYRASPEEKRRYGGSTVTQFLVRYVDAPHETKEITGYGKTPGERKSDAIRKFRQHESTPNPKRSWTGFRTTVFRSYVDAHRLDKGPAYDWKYAKEIRWLAREGLISGDDRRGYVLTPAGVEEAKRRRMTTNPTGTISAEERSVLEDLRNEAIDSEDDWGIDQETRDYLRAASKGEADQGPRGFLNDLAEVVDQNFRSVGEEGEDADPFYSRESANRAHASIKRARQRLPNPSGTTGQTENPRATHTDAVHTDATVRRRNPDAGATSARARTLSRYITS